MKVLPTAHLKTRYVTQLQVTVGFKATVRSGKRLCPTVTHRRLPGPSRHLTIASETLSVPAESLVILHSAPSQTSPLFRGGFLICQIHNQGKREASLESRLSSLPHLHLKKSYMHQQALVKCSLFISYRMKIQTEQYFPQKLFLISKAAEVL